MLTNSIIVSISFLFRRISKTQTTIHSRLFTEGVVGITIVIGFGDKE